ncbi:MAG: hypothetical protein ABI743_01585 [bacterium]
MGTLRAPLWLAVAVILVGIAPAVVSAAPASPAMPVEITMAAAVWDARTNLGSAFLTLESTDGLPHTFFFKVADDSSFNSRVNFRGWWITEEPYALKIDRQLAAQQEALRRLDLQRWITVAAFAPAIWPLAAGSAVVLSSPESTQYRNWSNQLGFDRWYLPLPDPDPDKATLQVSDDTSGDRTAAGWRQATVRPWSSSEFLLPCEGLLINFTSPDIAALSLQMIEPGAGNDQQPSIITPRAFRLYGFPKTGTTRGWQLPTELELKNAKATIASGAWVDQRIPLPGPGSVMQLGTGDGPAPGGDLPVFPLPLAIASLLAYTFAGWCLAPPRESMPPTTRLGRIGLGWLGGWAVAALLVPLAGIGFLGGGVVTLAIWQRQGLGSLSAMRVAAIWLFLIVWSLCCLPLVQSSGYLWHP